MNCCTHHRDNKNAEFDVCNILIEQMPEYLNLFSWLIPDSQESSFREDYVRDADQPTDVRKRPTDVRGIMKKPYLPQHRRLH